MYEYSYFLVSQQIDGISHTQSLVRPPQGGNSLNWILGHITTSRCNVLAMLDQPTVWDFSDCQPYIPDSDPVPEPDEIINFEVMVNDLRKTQDILMVTIKDLTEEKMQEVKDDQSIGEQLAGYAIHEAYHAGELGITKAAISSK